MDRPPRWLLATLALGLFALGSAGAWFYLSERRYLERAASVDLMAIAQARLDRIVAWRAEELGDAAILQESPFFARAVARWRAGHQPEIAADILTQLRSTRDHSKYEDVRLVDPAGRVLLATNGRTGGLDSNEVGALSAALRDRRPTMSDVRLSTDDSTPHLTLVAPLFPSGEGTSRPVGAVVHVVDARRLFSLIESWPSHSPSAEALLVRRDGDSLLFLNQHHYQASPALPRRMSLSRRDLPAVMAVLGTEGVVRAVDYRGVKVLAALRAVPGTPWFLVVKVDETEVLAVWRTRAALAFAALLGLVLVAGAIAIAVAQRSAKAHYRRLYEAEAALGTSEVRYKLLFESVTDAVFVHGLADDGAPGKFFEVNTVACERLGYTREELLHLSVRDIDAPESTVDARAIGQRLHQGETVLFEQTHVTKDGRRIPVEVHVQSFDLLGRVVVLSVVRDITERKRADETLRNREGVLQKIFDLLPVGLWFADKDGKLLRGNPAGVKIWGAEHRVSTSEYGVFKARRLPSGEEVATDDWALVHSIRDKVTVVDELLEIDAFDGKKRTILNYTAPVLDAQGEVQGAIVVNQDITERQHAEQALRALAVHLDAVREEEHTRIARQIHDELGQALTALRLDLTWVDRRLPKGDTALRRRMDGAVALTDEMITVGQRIVGELRPPILDDLGLVPAVEWYAQQLAKRSGLRIEVGFAAEEPVVADELAVTAYRIVQEALTNVTRHAQATHVTVRFSEQDGVLTLEIRDDGRGARDEVFHNPHSFGIVGMRERAASQGGALAITSSPGAGTTVRVTLPIERREEPEPPR